MPMVAMRLRPASRARPSEPSRHMSRWQWVSTIDAREQGLDLLDLAAGPIAEGRQLSLRDAERAEELLGRIGDPRLQQQRSDAQPLGKGVQHPIKLRSPV